MKELWIDEKTAQLVLDAIAWCNEDWIDALEWQWSENESVGTARNDFVRFCKDRGIAGVERQTKITIERVCD